MLPGVDPFTATSFVVVAASTSLLLATLGILITERAGVINLGVDGLMLIGAMAAFAVTKHTGSPFLGVAVAMGVSGGLAFFHALGTVVFLADQIVCGLAMNIFCYGAANFSGRNFVGQVSQRLEPVNLAFLAKVPYFGHVFFSQDALTYFAFLSVVIVWMVLYRTRPGLCLVAVGEDPKAADALGVSPYRIKIIAVTVGGMLMGAGGAHLSLSYTPGWVDGMTAGRGWIAVALVIFSCWNPSRILLGAILFGGINALQFRFQTGGANIPAAFLNMLPYVATIIAMVLFSGSKRSGPPGSLGIPYARGER